MKAITHVSTVFVNVFAILTIQLSMMNEGARPDAPGATKTAPPATQPSTQSTVLVKIENFAFIPKELGITAGTTVTWRNDDDIPHTATSKDDPQVFDSGTLDTDDKFSFTFSKPGKYPYYCKVHPHMQGVVMVK